MKTNFKTGYLTISNCDPSKEISDWEHMYCQYAKSLSDVSRIVSCYDTPDTLYEMIVDLLQDKLTLDTLPNTVVKSIEEEVNTNFKKECYDCGTAVFNLKTQEFLEIKQFFDLKELIVNIWKDHRVEKPAPPNKQVRIAQLLKELAELTAV